MSCPLLSAPEDVIDYMLQFLHVVDLYDAHCNHICKSLDILIMNKMLRIPGLQLIINPKHHIWSDKLMVGRKYHSKQIIIINAKKFINNKKIKHFMQLISFQIKNLIIMDKICTTDINLANVTHLQCVYPLNNILILKTLNALKWVTITALNKYIWNILSKSCPTLSSLITINSLKRSISDWCKDDDDAKNVLNTMNYLQILVICNTISIELVPYLLKASPSLVHFSVDGRVTINDDPIPYGRQTTLPIMAIPKNLIFLGISSNVASMVDIDFSHCDKLNVLNIPLLSSHNGSLKISKLFTNFIGSKNKNEILILFKKYKTTNFFINLDEEKLIMEIRSNFCNSAIIKTQMNIIMHKIHGLSKDNYLIRKILKSLFYENKLNFVDTKNINETIINYLTANGDNREYIELLDEATEIGYLCEQFKPLIID